MATLAEFGISSIDELTNEATYYNIDDEDYLYTDGLHGCYQLRESIHYTHVGGHPDIEKKPAANDHTGLAVTQEAATPNAKSSTRECLPPATTRWTTRHYQQ